MIEIVRNKAPKARQPWHVRVVVDGNSEPLLAGETLTGSEDAETAVEALGRLFSPVGEATYSAGALHVWLDEDEHGEKLSVPVKIVDEREETQAEKTPAKSTKATTEPTTAKAD